MTKPGVEKQDRVAELRQLTVAMFKLRDAETYTQFEIEEWADRMADVDMGGETINLPRIRRRAFQAAFQAGWFDDGSPELATEDFLLLRPSLVSALGDAVMAIYNKITVLDPAFT